VGTVKSRISRARDTLERLLLEGDSKPRPSKGVDRGVSRDEGAPVETIPTAR